MRRHTRLYFGQTKSLPAQRNALHQKSHISRKGAHRLLSLFVHLGFSLRTTMYAVPVLAGSYRHICNCKVLVQLVERCRKAAAPCTDHARADLHRLVEMRAVKKPVKTGDERRVRRSVVNGAGDDKPVRRLEFRRKFVDDIVKNALSRFVAFSAGDTAANVPVADLHGLDLNAARLKNIFHLAQRDRSITADPRAAVEH